MVYLFGDYVLDTDRYELRCGGEPLQIEPKVFDLLTYLIQQHGHVIGKEALLEQLWPDQFVSESALTYCIGAARKAIGDSGRAQRLIKTIHGRGYRFIAPVQERLEDAPEDAIEDHGVSERSKILPFPSPMPSDPRRLEVIPPIVVGADTLQETLRDWLQRLDPSKEVMQLGALLGLEFKYDVLRAVSPMQEAVLQQELAQLVTAGLLDQHGTPPDLIYRFKQVQLRDAAYQSMWSHAQQEYHDRIACVLTEKFPALGEAEPERIAHHYTEAGLGKEALPYWQKAAQKAIAQSNPQDAIRYLAQGVESLKRALDISAQTQLDLTLQLSISTGLTAMPNVAATVREQAFVQAKSYCTQFVEETPPLFQIQQGLWAVYLIRGELLMAKALAEQGLHLAQSMAQPPLQGPAQQRLGCTAFYLGELSLAKDCLETGLVGAALMSQTTSRDIPTSNVSRLIYMARILGWMGAADQALQYRDDALELAQSLPQPINLGLAQTGAAWLSYDLRDHGAALGQAEQAASIAAEHGLSHWTAQACALRGWALVEQGQVALGLETLRQGLSTYEATGAVLARPALLILLADACGQAGQLEQGLTTLEEADEEIARQGGHYYLAAECHRLNGELVLSLMPNREADAETMLQRAIEIAQVQQSSLLELRATTSLSRLWHLQGKTDVARQRLAQAVSQLKFAAGVEIADLKAAREVLNALI